MGFFYWNSLGMLYCDFMSMSVSLWAWTYEQDGIFLASFDDMDGICQEYYLPHWTNFFVVVAEYSARCIQMDEK